MNLSFPFSLPAPTAWYIALYILTLLLHVAFMSYVLAGSIMLGVAGLRGMLGRAGILSAWSAVTAVLKDWMPFALSAAITAGVAPLLFVQILYQQEFYTANLLSFHRWMAILPVLIVAFYLLYLLKAHRIEGRTALQGIVAMAVMACILFVGWSWVENHLLSLDRAAWCGQYQSGAMVYTSPAILPRLAFWVAAAFPTAALLLAWQLRAGASGTSPTAAARAVRPVAWVALITLIASALAWPVFPAELSTSGPRSFEPAFRGWALVGAAGAVLQAAVWSRACWAGTIGRPSLVVASLGAALGWIGTLAARECARLSAVDTESLFMRHQRVGTIAGLVVFLGFAVLGLGTIAWVVRSLARTPRLGGVKSG